MKPKQFFYILAVICLAIIGAGGFFYYQAASSVRASTEKLSRTLADIQVATDKSRELAKLSKEYESDVKSLLPQIENALPNDKRQSDVAAQLNSAASETGIRLGSIEFAKSTIPSATSQTQSASGLLAMPVTFTAEGSYSGMQTLLQRLENFPRQCDVTAVTMSKGSGKVTAQFKVNFFLKP